MPNRIKTKVIGAEFLVRELRKSSADIDKILKEVGIGLHMLQEANHWVAFEKYAELFERAALETNNIYFGLHAARSVDARDMGALGYLGLASRTLGDYLLLRHRYIKVVSEAFSSILTIEDDRVRSAYFQSRPSFSHYRQINEFIDCMFVTVYQQLIGSPVPPLEMRFCHAFDGDPVGHEELLGCPVSFNAEHGEVIIPRALLLTPVKSADSSLFHILKEHCESVLETRREQGSDLVGRFERTLLDLMPSGRARADIVATKLGMSERTLARKLTQAGTSYNESLDALRKELAVKYVQRPELQLAEIAFLLGYASQSSFCVAFKRWTGKTPLVIRKEI